MCPLRLSSPRQAGEYPRPTLTAGSGHAELSSRRKLAFSDYTQAVRNLAQIGYPADLVGALAELPGFRNVVIREYLTLDYDRVLAALQGGEQIRRFVRLVRDGELPD